MDDLLKETISLILTGFFASFRDEGKIDEGDKEKMILISVRYLIPYLSFVKENKTIFVLAQKKPELFHSKETLDFLYGNYFPRSWKSSGSRSGRGFLVSYYLRGIIALACSWVGGGCKEEMGQIAALISRLVGPKGFQDFV